MEYRIRVGFWCNAATMLAPTNPCATGKGMSTLEELRKTDFGIEFAPPHKLKRHA